MRDFHVGLLTVPLLLGCQAPAPVQPYAGPTGPTSIPYFVVRGAEEGMIVAHGSTTDLDTLIRTVQAGRYIVTSTTALASGVATLSLPAPGATIPMNAHCTPVTVNLTGERTTGRPFAFYRGDGLDVYAVLIGTDERAVSCLAAGVYIAGVEEDDVITLSDEVDVAGTPIEITLRAFSNEHIDSLPDGDVRVSASTSTALGGLPHDVAIIGFGEPDHGGADYLRARASFLLEGARAGRIDGVALEAGAAEVFAIDDYVAGDSVDIRAAVASAGYWMWDTEDFLGVLHQIRAHNTSPTAAKIHVFGVDVQYTQGAVDFLVGNASALHLAPEDVELLLTLRERRGDDYIALSLARRAALRTLLTALVATSADSLRNRSIRSRGAFVARALLRRCDTLEAIGVKRYAAREMGMADLVSAVAAGSPRTAVVYWAHNGHVARARLGGLPSAGLLLGQRFGAKYYSIGVFAVGGVSRAWDPKGEKGVDPIELPGTPPHYFESVMMRAAGNPESLVVALSRLPPALQKWLATPHRARDFGAVYPGDDAAARLFPFDEAFDAAVVFREVHPTVPTATGIRVAR